MKNIHILPTDKPSRLFKLAGDLHLHKECGIDPKRNQNIYITSDEEIKDSYVINTHTNDIYFENWYSSTPFIKKIVLTTDQELIKDGVQDIDDEFLEWFVKNPSCEEVEVEDYGNLYNFRYLILIPKEESKQETPEEIAQRLFPINTGDESLDYQNEVRKPNWISGAKWQQERMYSEEEVYSIIRMCLGMKESGKTDIEIKEMFEQLKKK